MTLSDLWTRFHGHDIFEVEYRKNGASSKYKVTIAQEETIPDVWNGTMFGDLDWLLNASRGFVSISWPSCFICLTETGHSSALLSNVERTSTS